MATDALLILAAALRFNGLTARRAGGHGRGHHEGPGADTPLADLALG